MKTIILFGLRRSGNHYLISKILQQYTNFVHINDTKLSYNKYDKYKNINAHTERIDEEWIGFKGVECVVISMEDQIIDFNELEKFNNISDCHILMLLRCPYTNLSSAWTAYRKKTTIAITTIFMWEIYAKIFINDNNLIKILYDEYISNSEYQTKILNKIGITEPKNLNNSHAIQWQESSFKHENKNKSRQIYKSLNNCACCDDKQFIELFENTNVNILWDKIMKLRF